MTNSRIAEACYYNGTMQLLLRTKIVDHQVHFLTAMVLVFVHSHNLIAVIFISFSFCVLPLVLVFVIQQHNFCFCYENRSARQILNLCACECVCPYCRIRYGTTYRCIADSSGFRMKIPAKVRGGC